mgnify:CR=1 FL=1
MTMPAPGAHPQAGDAAGRRLHYTAVTRPAIPGVDPRGQAR